MRSSFPVLPTVVVAVAMLASVPSTSTAQRRPGMGTNFYTTTGLLTGDVEVGTVNSTTGLAEVPDFALSLLGTAPVVKSTKRAWIVGARVQVLGLGNRNACYVTPDVTGCQNRRFSERGMVMTGGAFDIRSTILRAMVGPALYDVEGQGARLGTTVRVDFASPRQRGMTPTLFFTRTFLGRQENDAVGVSTLGAGFRWVRRR
jgi:hypothetical protein